MDGTHDDEVVAPGDGAQVPDDLAAGSRVEAARGLIEEKQLRAGDKLASNTDAALLPSRDTLADGCADEGVGLADETEGFQEAVDAHETFTLREGAIGHVREMLVISVMGQHTWCWQDVRKTRASRAQSRIR